MLTLYRRHLRNCKHRMKGRKFRQCKCPIQLEGTLRGEKVRRSLDLTSWEAASELIREYEARGSVTGDIVAMEDAASRYLKDCEDRSLAPGTMKLLKLLMNRLCDFCEEKRLTFVGQVGVQELRDFRSSWNLNPTTSRDRVKKLRAFFAFCEDSGWVDENPAKKVKIGKVDAAPTLPFSSEEMAKILKACDEYKDNHGKPGKGANRLRALVLLLRHAGLRIGDASALAKKRLQGSKLFLMTAKTNVPVMVPLPPEAVEALQACPYEGDYFFWTGKGTVASVTRTWSRMLEKVFKGAAIEGGHPHRFRDTMAVALLEKGVPIEDVAMLLGNSVQVALAHYAPWVKSRQDRLEERVKLAWT